MEKIISNLDTLTQEAAVFIKELAPRKEGATLITLSGTLGAGKTAFTKAIARALGIEDVVNSPTFIIQKIYALPQKPALDSFTHFFHIDAYRLEDSAALAPLGFDKTMYDRKNLIVLEWPEHVAGALHPITFVFSFEVLEDGSRRITIRE